MGQGAEKKELERKKKKKTGTHKTKRVNGKEKVRTCVTSKTASKIQAGKNKQTKTHQQKNKTK